MQMENQAIPSLETIKSDSPSEREKWEAEKAFRHREIAIKERELTNRETELKLKVDEQKSSTWRNPVFVALIGALAAAGGNAYISFNNGIAQRSLEKERSEQTRILEMIKTGDPDKAAENLDFLLSAGLISDPSLKDSLRVFLAEREAGSGPALAAESGSSIGGIVGVDDAKPVNTVKDVSFVKAAKSVGQIETFDKYGHMQQRGTAFLVAENLILTASHIISNDTQSCRLRIVGSDKVYKIVLPPLEEVSLKEPLAHGYAIYQVEGKPGSLYGYLPLSSTPPVIGESLGFFFFRSGPQQLVVENTPDCQIKFVDEHELIHLCDSGPGSSGGMLISAKTGQIVGIHLGTNQKGKFAIRADVIKRLSKIL